MGVMYSLTDDAMLEGGRAASIFLQEELANGIVDRAECSETIVWEGTYTRHVFFGNNQYVPLNERMCVTDDAECVCFHEGVLESKGMGITMLARSPIVGCASIHHASTAALRQASSR
jgi:hypothetical protein